VGAAGVGRAPAVTAEVGMGSFQRTLAMALTLALGAALTRRATSAATSEGIRRARVCIRMGDCIIKKYVSVSAQRSRRKLSVVKVPSR
jgi:hypothetical protein